MRGPMRGAPLRGEQIELRPMARSDAPALDRILRDGRVTRFLPPTVRRESGIQFVRRVLGDQRRGQGVAFVIVPRGATEAIGQIRFFHWSREARDAELGYWLRRSEWGQGWATTAVRLACGFGFRTMRLHRIEALVLDGNAASSRVLEKVGFHAEGRCRQSERVSRGWVDELRFGLLRGDWRAGNEA